MKQQLPQWLVTKDVEEDKQEIRAWLNILASPSAKPEPSEKVAWQGKAVPGEFMAGHKAYT